MSSRFIWLEVTVALATVLAMPVRAGEPLGLRVSPRVSLEPAVVAIDAIVEPHADNRGLKICVESLHYYRSSFVQLDGEGAPRVTSVRFPSVPAGSYEVTTILFGPGQKQRALVTQQVEVLGRAGG